MTPPDVRGALAAVLEAHIAVLADGRDDAVPDVHWARLDAVTGGMSTVLPGWVAGPVLGLGPAERAGHYRLRRDELTAVRPARDCSHDRTGLCRRRHDHWEDVVTDAAA